MLESTAESASSAGLKFAFNALPDTPQAVIDGFVAAGNVWSAYLADNVTVNIDIGFESLGPSTLGGASPNQAILPYQLGRERLIEDATSLYDLYAVSSLPEGDSIATLINLTAENGGGLVPYLDNDGSVNNANLQITYANAKAIGLSIDETLSDGLIHFNRDMAWDFNRDDGIVAGANDFVGVAIHEIGHILGFNSQVDALDETAALGLASFISEDFYTPTPLDLFRFSTDSFVQGAIDLTADSRDKYFSFYQGADGVPLSTGSYLGDGRQASHWKDISIGIMDATMGTGTQNDITIFDHVALDVIGWDVA